MKAIINYLFFDKDVVAKVKSSKINKEQLYLQLVGGKITLQEFVEMSK